jgi:hypothetical protein
MSQVFSVKTTAPPDGVPARVFWRGGVKEAGHDNIEASEASRTFTCSWV